MPTLQKPGQGLNDTAVAGLPRRFKISWDETSRKIIGVKIIIALGLFCGFVFSSRLWVASRLFPLSPVSDVLPAIPFPLDRIWFLAVLALLLAVTIVAQPRKLTLIFLAFAGALSLWDQARWQPWFFQYFFMMAAAGFYAWTKPEDSRRGAALNVCRLIIVFTYFWSGVQKLNANFVREAWPDIAHPLLHALPPAVGKLPPFLALMVPVLEILIGLGLATRKCRDAAVALAVATHIFVLILLVCSGENTVVWPWNIAMGLFVVILFWRDKETGPRQILAFKNGFHGLVFLLFAILPAFSFFDLWDSYLSSALYSGNTDQAVIYVSSAVMDRLPAVMHPHIWQSSPPLFLDMNRWSYAELNVPVYPEPRVYRKVAQQVCALAGNSTDIRLRIKKKPDPLSGLRKSEYYDCEHL